MIKLYGAPLSNYYNMVKAVMIEKGISFEEVHILPNQESDFLIKSPMGKVPCLETEQGFLTEAGVMINYLDALDQGPSFYPEDAFERAKVQELIRHLELYIELPARRLYGEVFFNRPTTDAVKEDARAILERGFASLASLAKYSPYLAGEDITYADFYFRFSVGVASVACKKGLDWDVYNEQPDIRELIELMDSRESIKQVLADQAKSA